jgi:hypothetical protein
MVKGHQNIQLLKTISTIMYPTRDVQKGLQILPYHSKEKATFAVKKEYIIAKKYLNVQSIHFLFYLKLCIFWKANRHYSFAIKCPVFHQAHPIFIISYWIAQPC